MEGDFCFNVADGLFDFVAKGDFCSNVADGVLDFVVEGEFWRVVMFNVGEGLPKFTFVNVEK